MKMEIERKFLIKKGWTIDDIINWLPMRDYWRKSHLVRGYFQYGLDAGVIWFQRIWVDETLDAEKWGKTGDAHALMTVKHRISVEERMEAELDLNPNQARVLLGNPDMMKGRVQKFRYDIIYNGVHMEIDVFYGNLQGLMILEVEMAHKDQVFRLPPWVGEEVTADPRYNNCNLAFSTITDLM